MWAPEASGPPWSVFIHVKYPKLHTRVAKQHLFSLQGWTSRDRGQTLSSVYLGRELTEHLLFTLAVFLPFRVSSNQCKSRGHSNRTIILQDLVTRARGRSCGKVTLHSSHYCLLLAKVNESGVWKKSWGTT